MGLKQHTYTIGVEMKIHGPQECRICQQLRKDVAHRLQTTERQSHEWLWQRSDQMANKDWQCEIFVVQIGEAGVGKQTKERSEG